MMTRIEKYAQYRQEIANESQLQFLVSNNVLKIEKYNKAINKINKNILVDSESNKIKLQSMVQQNGFMQTTPREIVDAVNFINSFSLTMVDSNIKEFFDQIKNSSIIDENSNNIKDSWLFDSNDDFELFISQIENSGLKSPAIIFAENDLKKNYDKSFESVKIESDTITLVSIENKNKASLYIYIVSNIIVITLIIAVAVLIIAGLIIDF